MPSLDADADRSAATVLPQYGPGYDPSGQLEGWQVARVAANAGFDDALVPGFSVSNLVMAVAISKRESGWITDIQNAGGAPAWGLWQIYLPAHPDCSLACATDAWCAAQKAWAYSGHGTAFFGPWAPPPGQTFIDAAAAVATMRAITEAPVVQTDERMSVTVLDTKHTASPAGRVRFVRLKISPGQFQLVSFNGAKIAGFTLPHTQHSNGAVLGVEVEPDGVHFVVTADDGGTFRYAFVA